MLQLTKYSAELLVQRPNLHPSPEPPVPRHRRKEQGSCGLMALAEQTLLVGAFFFIALGSLIFFCDFGVFILITPSQAFKKLFLASYSLSREPCSCSRDD